MVKTTGGGADLAPVFTGLGKGSYQLKIEGLERAANSRSQIVLRKPSAPLDPARMGLALFPLDRDGVVSPLSDDRLEPPASSGPRCHGPPFKAADRIAAEKNEAKRPCEELIFNFTGDRSCSSEGDFAAAHDTYRTAVGERSGVELMAYAIESESRAASARRTPGSLSRSISW